MKGLILDAMRAARWIVFPQDHSEYGICQRVEHAPMAAVEMRPNSEGVYVEATKNDLDREVMLSLACPRYILVDLACDIVVCEGTIDDLLDMAVQYREANPDDDCQLCIYEKKSVVQL